MGVLVRSESIAGISPEEAMRQAQQRLPKDANGASCDHCATPRASSSPTKNKLKTSEEVVNRLRWDADYEDRKFLIGYWDRFRGMLEINMDQFLQDEIPFHRVYYIREVMSDDDLAEQKYCHTPDETNPEVTFRLSDPECERYASSIVWDRNTRLDAVFNSGDTASLDCSVSVHQRMIEVCSCMQNMHVLAQEMEHVADVAAQKDKLRRTRRERQERGIKAAAFEARDEADHGAVASSSTSTTLSTISSDTDAPADASVAVAEEWC